MKAREGYCQIYSSLTNLIEGMEGAEDTTLVRFEDHMMAGVRYRYPREQIDATFKGYEDAWLSWACFNPRKVIPGLPPAYINQHKEDRVIYVDGFPFACDCKYFLNWAREWAGIERTITIVDMRSQCTFRWLITTTPCEAEKLLETIHKMTVTMYQPRHDGTVDKEVFTVRACLSPLRAVFDNDTGNQADERLPSGPNIPTIHGHPSPPIRELQRLSLQQSTPTVATSNGDSSSNFHASARSTDTLSAAVTEVSEGPSAAAAPSWASLAKGANPDAEMINLHPPKKFLAAPRLTSSIRSNTLSSVTSDEPLVDQARVVFLLNMPHNMTLQQVSDAVMEGPLRSINFGVDETKGEQFVGVVFQLAQDAESFYQVLCKERADSRPGRFKFVVDAIRGDPFPMDSTLRAMDSPTFASRRLTLVKSKFFFMIKERDLRSFCEKIVSPETIQLIWLYNGGNATIVFADVSAAIKVKSKLDEQSNGVAVFDRQNLAAWIGLQTTYSKDPCVAPLELKTAITT